MLTPFLTHAWASSPERLAIAAAVTLGFAVLACALLRGVNRSGALAGDLACFLLFAGGGPGGFRHARVLFVMTWVSTRLGTAASWHSVWPSAGRPECLAGTGESGGNCRSASVAFSATGNRVWLVAAVAALAEAATDTVASEIGQYRGVEARLITTWERVPAGTDGGITIPGSIAGLAAGLVIAAVATLGGILLPASSGFRSPPDSPEC
jgi:uncharacterized membrane protein